MNVLCPNWKNVLTLDTCNKEESHVKSLSQVKYVSRSMSVQSVQHSQSNDVKVKSSHEGEQVSQLVSQLQNEFKLVFNGQSNACIKVVQVDLKLIEDSTPIFHRAYELPYALRNKVESELNKMVREDILTKVTTTNWASPIVVVPKKDSKEIRI